MKYTTINNMAIQFITTNVVWVAAHRQQWLVIRSSSLLAAN